MRGSLLDFITITAPSPCIRPCWNLQTGRDLPGRKEVECPARQLTGIKAAYIQLYLSISLRGPTGCLRNYRKSIL